MSQKNLHDIINTLQRLEIVANLMSKKDFSEFSLEEMTKDIEHDLESLKNHFKELSNGQ
jgi:hypothetical protein